MPLFKRVSPINWGVMLFLLALLGAAYLWDADLSQRASRWTAQEVHWYGLIPPLLAVGLAICIRQILLVLLLSVMAGVGLLHGFEPLTLFRETAENYLWNNLTGQYSFLIVGFVFFLIGMVSVINRAGGTQGVIRLFTKTVHSARRACLAAAGMGVAIFFDDYANILVIGSMMRPLTDALKISREKLAYIVDSTAAPVAGVALVSTWIGFEVEQLQKISSALGLGMGGYALFLKMLPFRFYCYFALSFVFLNAFLRRDFGPMLTAERRATQKGETFAREDDTMLTQTFAAVQPKAGIPCRWINALLPVAAVILATLAGILSHLSILRVLCLAALFGSAVSFVLVVAQKLLTPMEFLRAWLQPWRVTLILTAFILLTWAIRQVCEELGVGYFLMAAASGWVSPLWIPLITFTLGAAVGFATGTSWGAMAILIPTLGPLSFQLGGMEILVLSMAAILDGAIFGDHCSPISDTTILSSAASNCDHLDHVKTQLPYALVCLLAAALFGYLPAVLGVPVWICYGAGLAFLSLLLFLFGKSPIY